MSNFVTFPPFCGKKTYALLSKKQKDTNLVI